MKMRYKVAQEGAYGLALVEEEAAVAFAVGEDERFAEQVPGLRQTALRCMRSRQEQLNLQCVERASLRAGLLQQSGKRCECQFRFPLLDMQAFRSDLFLSDQEQRHALSEPVE